MQEALDDLALISIHALHEESDRLGDDRQG